MFIVCYEVAANNAPDMAHLRKLVSEEFQHYETDGETVEEGRSSDYAPIYKARDELGGHQLLTSTFAVSFSGNASELRDHLLSQFPQDLKDRLELLVFGDSSNFAAFPAQLQNKILQSSAA